MLPSLIFHFNRKMFNTFALDKNENKKVTFFFISFRQNYFWLNPKKEELLNISKINIFQN